VYRGSTDDIRDGFIHFSTASQVVETQGKHFFGQTGLFLIAVDATCWADALRWSPRATTSCFRISTVNSNLGAVTGIQDMHAPVRWIHDIRS